MRSPIFAIVVGVLWTVSQYHSPLSTFGAAAHCYRRYECHNGECVSILGKCNGIKDCKDNTDENPGMCRANSKEFPINSTMKTVLVPYDPLMDHIEFRFWNSQYTFCHVVKVGGVTPYGSLGYHSYGFCANQGPECSRDFPAVVNNPPGFKEFKWGEYAFVVKRVSPDEVKVWLEGYPNQNITVAMVASLDHLQVRPTYWQQDPRVTFIDGERPQLPAMKHDCGRPAAIVPRIGNGVAIDIHKFPWHVGIYYARNVSQHDFRCGGSIINAFIVISAAHCFKDDHLTLGISLPPDYREIIKVAAGKTFSEWEKAEDEGTQQIRDIAEVHMRRDYSGWSKHYANDIALVELRHSLAFTPAVRPVCVDWKFEQPILKRHDLGQVVGWGCTKWRCSRKSETLLFADLPYVPRTDCFEGLRKEDMVMLQDYKFCAGYHGDNGQPAVMSGDSGGGLVFEGMHQWFLRGVVSVGIAHSNTYSSFTDVSHYIPWIKKIREAIDDKNHT